MLPPENFEIYVNFPAFCSLLEHFLSTYNKACAFQELNTTGRLTGGCEPLPAAPPP